MLLKPGALPEGAEVRAGFSVASNVSDIDQQKMGAFGTELRFTALAGEPFRLTFLGGDDNYAVYTVPPGKNGTLDKLSPVPWTARSVPLVDAYD